MNIAAIILLRIKTLKLLVWRLVV